jgi:triacylglycerol lipase
LSKHVVALSLCLLSVVSCKPRDGAETKFGGSSSSSSPPSAQAREGYDVGAVKESDLDISDTPRFCHRSDDFSIINAFWLGVISEHAYMWSYGWESRLKKLAENFGGKWRFEAKFLSTSTGGGLWSNDAQAVFLKNTVAGYPVAILAFRGTEGKLQDWITDLKFMHTDYYAFDENGIQRHQQFANSSINAPVKLHVGFKTAVDNLWPQLDPLLQGLDKNTLLFITGHSLGGAMAQIASARVMMDKRQSGLWRYNIKQGGVYTYGSPRVGNENFTKRYLEVMRTRKQADGLPGFPLARFRFSEDIVTRVPNWQYLHLGDQLFISSAARMYSFWNHPTVKDIYVGSDGSVLQNFQPNEHRIAVTEDMTSLFGTVWQKGVDMWNGFWTDEKQSREQPKGYAQGFAPIDDHGMRNYVNSIGREMKIHLDLVKEAGKQFGAYRARVKQEDPEKFRRDGDIIAAWVKWKKANDGSPEPQRPEVRPVDMCEPISFTKGVTPPQRYGS